MNPLRSVAQLKDAVGQAIFEFEELSLCVQEDLDDELYDYSGTFQAMAAELSRLLEELNECDEYSDREGLGIMPRVTQLRSIIPFYALVRSIDSACRLGVRNI